MEHKAPNGGARESTQELKGIGEYQDQEEGVGG
ncbi:hypothetical protein T4B_7322 [Trichinella pseudospiralis]|uniref:Uncharacterized protein n=1 Tax=Trichinella pseudospiralis TaxID=6337 RepID=A0A0V1G9H5_TRIPS|nr:hypothetical protein T4B_7322 [Trichinella pseudospiralis]